MASYFDGLAHQARISKSLLEPCLYVHYAPGGSVDGLILIEVDDLAIGTKRMQETEFQQRVPGSVPFWEV